MKSSEVRKAKSGNGKRRFAVRRVGGDGGVGYMVSGVGCMQASAYFVEGRAESMLIVEGHLGPNGSVVKE